MTEELNSSNHPPLPPTTEDDRHAWLRLLRSRRVGPATFHRLLDEHGTAQNALAALPEVARTAGIEGYEICPAGVIDAEFKAARAAKARLLCLGDPDYPQSLSDIADAPPLLWTIGDPAYLSAPDDRPRGRPQRLVAGHPHGALAGRRTGRGRLRHRLGPGARRRCRGPSRRPQDRHRRGDGRRGRQSSIRPKTPASLSRSAPRGCASRNSPWA